MAPLCGCLRISAPVLFQVYVVESTPCARLCRRSLIYSFHMLICCRIKQPSLRDRMHNSTYVSSMLYIYIHLFGFHAHYVTDLSYNGWYILLTCLNNQRVQSISGRIQYPGRWIRRSNILGIDQIRVQSLHEGQSPSVGGQHTIEGG